MIQDVETRWNSTYNMLERICEQQASICAALVDLKRVDLMLQDGDVKIMENLVEILKPFFQITETICGENYTTVSSIKPLLHHLLNTALDPRSNDLGAIKQLKEAVKQNLQQRYQDPETAKLLDIACFLDPRFKELPFLSVVERIALHNLVREEAAAIYIDILSAKKESQSSSMSCWSFLLVHLQTQAHHLRRSQNRAVLKLYDQYWLIYFNTLLVEVKKILKMKLNLR